MKRIIVIFGALILIPAASGAEVDWNTVPGKSVSLFYPGVASWEYLVGSDHSIGANAVIRGERACQDCHITDGMLNIRADDIIKGKLRIKSRKIPFEPEPPKGLSGLKDIEVQAAYDAANFYLRLKWPSLEGAGFKDPSLYDKGDYDRVSVQLNGNIRSFGKAGCFISCHNDTAHMPDSPAESAVYANPFYYKQKRRDVRSYAYFTRTRGWSSLKPEQEMERYLKSGGFMDLWVVGFKGQEVVTSDESIFYDRVKDTSQDIEAQGSWQDGFYTVVITRKLTTKDRMDIQFQEGKAFTVGFAVHDDNSGHRKHFVSFPVSVILGKGQADLTAAKITEVKIIDTQTPVPQK